MASEKRELVEMASGGIWADNLPLTTPSGKLRKVRTIPPPPTTREDTLEPSEYMMSGALQPEIEADPEDESVTVTKARSWGSEVEEEEEERKNEEILRQIKKSDAPFEVSGGFSSDNITEVAELFYQQKEEEDELINLGISHRAIELISRQALRNVLTINTNLYEKLTTINNVVDNVLAENQKLYKKVEEAQVLDERLAELETKIERLSSRIDEKETEWKGLLASGNKTITDMNRSRVELQELKKSFRKAGIGGSMAPTTPESDKSATSAVADARHTTRPLPGLPISARELAKLKIQKK